MIILLLNPPFKSPIIRDNYCCFTPKSKYLWPPTDLLFISGLLSKNNYKLFAIDAIAENLSTKEVIKKILEIKPEVIISMTGTASFSSDKVFFNRLSKQFKSKLILNGNIAAFEPKKVFKEIKETDAIIHNFMSDDINLFLEGSKKLSNISVKKGKKITLGQINFDRKKIREIKDVLPNHRLFPLDKYTTPFMKQKPLTSVITTFGCPFACKFCVASKLNFAQRSIESLKKEFDLLKKEQIKEIFFQDSTFNANKRFVISLCKLMVKENYKFTWSANIHSVCFDEEIAKWMKKAGCHTVNIGVENASNSILKNNNKATNNKKITDVFNLCNKVGLMTLGYFIIGLPNETTETIKKTIEYAKELNPTFASFSIATADYGTELRKEALKNNLIIKKAGDFDSSSKTNLQLKNMKKDEVEKLIKYAHTSFYLRPTKLIQILILSIKNKTLLTNLSGGIKIISKVFS
jgi:anaerobic magnesium-protoporphyrin IX monomethyl ester cyclase